ncbi:protein of unknown function DUF445 [Thermosediminibacter oceani DSM 16646]|uniref:DUF445 domain-containing protein n=2 Tax=Thermosediminibacter TaxID=291988 RepID=D9RXT8_THEOJ|nr:protein of unknown function DUF445 [Thermosediminibacter oceani DSM 16646]
MSTSCEPYGLFFYWLFDGIYVILFFETNSKGTKCGVEMMNYNYLILQLILMPFIGAFIGWETNVLAIKLIFRPLKPVRILGFQMQGLIPKRRAEISKNIGETLEKEVLSSDDIVERLTSDNIKRQILSNLKNIVEEKANEKLPAFIPQPLRTGITAYLKETVDRHGEDIFDELKVNLAAKIREEVKLGRMVEEKINALDLEQLENLIIKLSRKELRQIEILGGVIGFFIGVVQAVFSYYVNFLR